MLLCLKFLSEAVLQMQMLIYNIVTIIVQQGSTLLNMIALLL